MLQSQKSNNIRPRLKAGHLSNILEQGAKNEEKLKNTDENSPKTQTRVSCAHAHKAREKNFVPQAL